MKNENLHLKSELDKYIKKSEELNTKIQQIQEESTKLKGEILIRKNSHQEGPNPKKDIINNLGDFIQSYNEQINDLKKEKNELKDIIEKTTKENEEIKKENEKLKQNNRQINLGNEISVFINSYDQKISCEIKCKENELFIDVEKKLYEKYNEYRDTNNSFLIGDRTIFRFKTLRENNIRDKDKIKLKKI